MKNKWKVVLLIVLIIGTQIPCKNLPGYFRL